MLFTIYAAVNIIATIVLVASFLAGLYTYGLEASAHMQRLSQQLAKTQLGGVRFVLQGLHFVVLPMAFFTGLLINTALVSYSEYLEPDVEN